ncbi:MAG TPA: helix-turn-helix domain-containing protein [Thermoanaerobaculia bacterium]|nr:helix-turn-helix domain-containing protein [Thermoanaerobaculia bacterium]
MDARKPAPHLADLVESFWLCESYGGGGSERLLPSATTQIIFTLDPDGRMASSFVGPRSRVTFLDTSRAFRAFGVHLKLGGALPLIGASLRELRDRAIALETLWGAAARNLTAELWEPGQRDRFGLLQSALDRRLRLSRPPDPEVRRALTLFEGAGKGSVRAVVDAVATSPRRFTRTFEDQVGLHPVLLRRLLRFTRVLERLEARSDVEWVDLALGCGYFDQAHFNHEFREFTGMSPSAYRRHRLSRTHVANVG